HTRLQGDWSSDVCSSDLRRGASFDFGHLFATRRAQLARALATALPRLEPGGMLWLSWPKKSSGVTSDISEDKLREIALPLGLVRSEERRVGKERRTRCER